MSDIRVLVVDDHPLFAQGTAEIIERLPGVSAIGFAIELDEAVRRVVSMRPDVILCDILLGDRPAGLDLPGRVAAAGVACPVLFISQFHSAAMVEQAARAGGAGVIPKLVTATELAEAIVAVHELRPIPHRRAMPVPGPRPPAPREVEIMTLIAEGSSSGRVAARLGISERTVDTHLARLFARYKCTTRTQLLLLADRHGWLGPRSDWGSAGAGR